jgi:hypothetical protein
MITLNHPARLAAEEQINALDAIEPSERMEPEHTYLRHQLARVAASPSDPSRADAAAQAWSNYSRASDLHAVMPREERARHAEDLKDPAKARAAAAALAKADEAMIELVGR